jgi:hypothetical protein
MPELWTAWFALSVAAFAGLETWALMTGRKTLSRCVWDLSRKWPPVIFLAGFVVGALATHFFWICQGCPLPGGML